MPDLLSVLRQTVRPIVRHPYFSEFLTERPSTTSGNLKLPGDIGPALIVAFQFQRKLECASIAAVRSASVENILGLFRVGPQVVNAETFVELELTRVLPNVGCPLIHLVLVLPHRPKK